MVQPDIKRDVAVAPLRIIYNPLDGNPKIYDKFLPVSVSEGRKAGFTVWLSPSKPDSFLLEDPEKPGNYGLSSVAIDCKTKGLTARCEQTLGLKLANLTEPGSYTLTMEVIDAYAGKVGDRSVHFIEVVREPVKDEDKLLVSVPTSPDFGTKTADILTFNVEEPGLTTRQHVRADIFYIPSYLAADKVQCNRNGTKFECNANVRLTSSPPSGFSTDLIILTVSRSNLPLLHAVHAVVTKLPTKAAATVLGQGATGAARP